MTVALGTDDVFYKGAIADLVPRERCGGLAELRKQLALLTVVVKVHQEREFDRIAVLDRVLLPLTTALSWVLHPIELAREIGATDNIDVAVAVDVDSEVAEVVDVIIGKADGAELMLDPAGTLVPVFAGDDIEFAVAVDVGDGAGFIRAQIDQVLLKGDVFGAADGPGDGGAQRQHSGGDRSRAHGEQPTVDYIRTFKWP